MATTRENIDERRSDDSNAVGRVRDDDGDVDARRRGMLVHGDDRDAVRG
jgi:hypothetical protein